MSRPDPEQSPEPGPDRTPEHAPGAVSPVAGRASGGIPLRIAGHLNPELLVPPSVAQLDEAPALRSLIDCTVAARLKARARFPHTIIRGPRDVGKRAIATVIAAEMAVPARVLEWTDVRSPQSLHEFFREIPEHGIAIISRIDLVPVAMMRDIALAARRTKIPMGQAEAPWTAELEKLSGRRPCRRYADFTIIGTSEGDVSPSFPFTGWVERTMNVERTEAGEQARLARIFGRVGITVSPTALKGLAMFCFGLGLRTVSAAEAVLDWMAYNGVTVLDDAAAVAAVEAVLEPCAEPEAHERLREMLAANAVRESEAANAGRGRVIVP